MYHPSQFQSVRRRIDAGWDSVFSYYPLKIGDYVSIGAGSIIEAAAIGNGVEIGKNCIIVRRSPFPFFSPSHDLNR